MATRIAFIALLLFAIAAFAMPANGGASVTQAIALACQDDVQSNRSMNIGEDGQWPTSWPQPPVVVRVPQWFPRPSQLPGWFPRAQNIPGTTGQYPQPGYYPPATGQYPQPGYYPPTTGQYPQPGYYPPTTGQYPRRGYYPPTTAQYPQPGYYPPTTGQTPRYYSRTRNRYPSDDNTAYRYPQPENPPTNVPQIPNGQTATRPSGYGTFGRSVIRVPESQLPLRLYSNDPSAADAVRRAVDSWNTTARALSLKAPFEVTSSPQQADFMVDWSGQGISGRTIGMTKLSYNGSRARVEGVTMRPYRSLGVRAPEVLAHEMGHVLGLGHSEARPDLMYAIAHGYPGYVQMSDRDRQMVSWLYNQSDYVPIVASRGSGWGGPLVPTGF